jgi:23S rRNA (uridine2552-2'-O)-methyltransferase
MADNPWRRADRFTTAAKAQGFPARSVFKLDAIQAAHRLIRPGDRVLDLGTSPGSWAQRALALVGSRGRVIGVDVVEPSVSGFVFLQASALDVTPEAIHDALGGPCDAVLSDMAPNTMGDRDADHFRQIELARRALELAISVSRPGARFACKVFDGEDAPSFVSEVRAAYGKVARMRPEAVRQASREFFIVGLDRRAAGG